MKKLKIMLLSMGLVSMGWAAAVVGPSATVTFEPKSTVLTTQAKDQLSSLVKQARDSGRIDHVRIAAWADNPAPREGEDLSKGERDLAASRLKAVEDYLKSQKVSDINMYNMAEGASWLSRMLRTETAEFKTEIGRGIEAPLSKDAFQVFKKNGEPSKTVVLMLMKRPYAE